MGELRIQKSYFDVLGICCPSEVPLIERILKPTEGIHKVSVVVPSKTLIVEHDPLLVSQLQIVKALNQARLEATVRAYGTDKIIKKWPSPYILACGIFLIVSLFQRFFHPLRWLAIAAVAVGLPPIVLRSIVAIRRYTLDINILMLIAVSGAVALRDFSEAGFIVFLFTIAEWLETRASHKATAGMSALMSMAPQKAILAETGQVVDARDVKVNTILAVKAGEVIPIDGIVVEGKSEVNEQSLTGESFPVAKQAQSLVWAGTLNIDGYISVKTTALAEHSAVAKMARLVEEAQNSRSKTQRLIDSCAKYYTPAAVIIAGGVAVVPLILHANNRKHYLQLALVLLVSACPCALVLSTPVATFCALLKAARIGLLVKGGDVLEALAKTKVVAFDKTGTITRGEFNVVELRPLDHHVAKDALLYWISSIESKSSHPMASALVDHARSNSIKPKPDNVSEFQIFPGEGVYGEIDGKKIYIGNKRIATRAGCDSVPYQGGMKEAVTRGYVFSGAALIGMFTLSDSCRTGAAEAIRELKSLGVKIVMLTGDSSAAAMYAHNQLGEIIDVVHAELLPEDKVRIINELKTKEGPTAMVGDGMNDAPALAAANVGISMGISGSAVAMETSHITLMSNDILKIPKAIRLAKRTHNKIMANILFSVITKIAILALAIAGHPLLWAAVLADVGTCLIVILNSMMLLQTRNPKMKKTCCSSSHGSDVHNHRHVECGAVHCGHGAHKEHKHIHGHEDQCSKKESCQTQHCGDGVHKEHKHGHAHEDQCSKKRSCATPHCNDGAHKEHKHRHVHEDRCSKKRSCGTRDDAHCCEESAHAKNTNHKHLVAMGCDMEHHCEDAHDGLGAECHGHHHHSNGAHLHHVQEVKHVGCYDGSREDDHGYGLHVQCGSEHHDKPTHSHTSANHAHEHLVSIASESENHSCDHGSDVSENCSYHTEHEEISGCCENERKEIEKSVCDSSAVLGGLGRGEEIRVCHETEEKKHEKRVCCSASMQGGYKRIEIGGCCQSYRRRCGKKDGCCAGGMMHLPEIVIE